VNFFWIISIGTLGGMASGLLGVGGGLLFVPLLVFFLGFDMHTAIGTSLAVIVPTAMIALFRHGQADAVDWKTALIIAFFAVAGAWLGAAISLKLNTVILRRLFAGLLVLVAVRLFFKP